MKNHKRSLYLDKILPYKDKPLIKILSGIRRCGKSYLMKQIIEEFYLSGIKQNQIVYINKELFNFDFITGYKELNKYIIDKFDNIIGTKYILIDEIQEIEQWERAITSFFAEGQYDIYITGSNARLLSSEIATLLTGRYVEINLFTLNFNEFIQFRSKEFSNYEAEFYNYLKFGGFPVIHFFDYNEELIFQYINSLYDTILIKDIVSRYNIRNVQLFENLCRYVFDNIGNIFSGRSIAKYLKAQQISIGLDTIQNYLSYLENSFLVYKVKRYDLKGKKILDVHEKYYLADVGLKNAIFGYREKDIAGLLENLVFLKLKQSEYKISIGKYLDYEIDFIAEKGTDKIYVQVAYLLNSVETTEREYKVLRLIPDNYPKYVLSMDKYGTTNDNGIIRMNIIDFLKDF